MMPKQTWLIFFGLSAYLAFAINQFPASTAYRWFAPSELSLTGVEGTIWSASARLGSYEQFYFENLNWKLDPVQLLLFRITGEIEASFLGGFISTRASFFDNQALLTSLRGGTTMSALREFLPIRGTEGQINLDLDEVSFIDSWPTHAQGTITLRSVAVPPLVPNSNGTLIQLGNHFITLDETPEGGLSGSFSDQGGPIESSGSWMLNMNKDFLIEGVLKARPSADAALIQGINFMTSEPDEAGNREFSFAGSL
jgi:hypothetical protein